MGLESGTYISDLNSANPLAGDPRSEGDDHIRLLKSTIKNTFPNINGAVNASDEDLAARVTSGTFTAGPNANRHSGLTDIRKGVDGLVVMNISIDVTGAIADGGLLCTLPAAFWPGGSASSLAFMGYMYDSSIGVTVPCGVVITKADGTLSYKLINGGSLPAAGDIIEFSGSWWAR